MMTHELEAIIEPAVTAYGYELWGCEWSSVGRGQQLLRVYVDSAEGVNVDKCAKISRQISAVLDVEDPIQGRYYLEVSSPGIERPFFKAAQCQGYLGHAISVRLKVAKAGRRNFSGTLQAVENEQIHLQLEDQTMLELAWRDIDKAHLVAKR